MNLRPLALGFGRGLFFPLFVMLGMGQMTSHAAGPPKPGTAVAAADSGDDSNPYSVIVERNIFHLNPPPPPPEPEKPKVELPVIKITGIINIGAVSKVLFVAMPKGAKEPVYYSLTEGEKSGDGKMQLVKIHSTQDGVDILNDGTPATLTLKDDTLAPNPPAPATAAVPGLPGQRPIPGNGIPGRQLFRPGGGPPMPGTPNGFPIPMRGRVALP